MTYQANEESVRGASPIELYRFVIGLDEYLYTSQEDDVVDGLDTYLAVPIQRSQLQFEGEVAKSSLQITLDRQETIAQQFIVQPPATVVTLYVYRYHESDGVGSKVNIWNGRVIDVRWRNNQVTFNAESVYTSINRQGLQRTYGFTCPYTLYDAECGVNLLAFQVPATVETIDGTTITAAAIGTRPDGYFAGGFIRFDIVGKPSEYRSILTHTGNTIVIGYTIPGLGVGSDILVHPGCAHNLDDCFNKFGNGNRYGGFPYQPTVNPFNGTTLF